MAKAATKKAKTSEQAAPTEKSLFYTKPTVLSSVTHKNTKIAPVDSYSFANALNSSVLVGQELMEAAKSYPIMFITLAGDAIMPMAIMGLENNLFVNDEGTWQDGAYIPAFVRRYPFIVAEGVTGDNSLAVCIDSAYSGYDAEEGERLFDDEGKQTPFMANAMKFIETYQAQYELTKVFVNFLKEHELLKSVDASIKLADGKQFTMRQLQVIDEEKVKNLSDEHLLLLARKGFLAWVYAHLFSISNFARVISRKK